MFHVGQKVVCVGDYTAAAALRWAQDLCIEMPQKDSVYTVRRIVQRQCGTADTGYGIMLAEILNGKNYLDKMGVGGLMEINDKNTLPPDEMAFDVRDFRPLITIEQFSAASRSSFVDA